MLVFFFPPFPLEMVPRGCKQPQLVWPAASRELGQVELRNAHASESVDVAGKEAPSERQRRRGTPTMRPGLLGAAEMLS